MSLEKFYQKIRTKINLNTFSTENCSKIKNGIKSLVVTEKTTGVRWWINQSMLKKWYLN